MNGKQIEFDGSVDNFKTKNNETTIQIKTTSSNLSLDSLSEVSDGAIRVYLESSQMELIDELNDEFTVNDILDIYKAEHKQSDGSTLTECRVITKNGNVYSVSEDLLNELEAEMPEEPFLDDDSDD